MTHLSDCRTGVVRPDQAVLLADGPLGARLLADRADTAGGPAFVVHDPAPRALGSPVHTHRREDEWSYVLAGQVGVQVGELLGADGPPDLARVAAIAAEHGLDIDPDPVPRLARTHGPVLA
jgi:hypothetical protein